MATDENVLKDSEEWEREGEDDEDGGDRNGEERESYEENGEGGERGVLREWKLLLHGTKKSPYVSQTANLDRHAKLAVVKREHERGIQFGN